jgi:hypothetical protein
MCVHWLFVHAQFPKHSHPRPHWANDGVGLLSDALECDFGPPYRKNFLEKEKQGAANREEAPTPSPLYDKGHPILGLFRTWPLIFRIVVDSESAPTEIPRRLKNNFEKKKKKVIKTTPKKGPGHCLLRWPAGVKKKKSGLSRRKLVMPGWQMPSYPLPTHLPTKHYEISAPARVFSHRAVYF